MAEKCAIAKDVTEVTHHSCISTTLWMVVLLVLLPS
ncbi:hypothetical protein CsSME_00023489 [Camellia sinensis var. sinensis]